MARVVVLIHGLARTSRSMRSVENFLAGQGYQTVSVDYPSRRASIADLARDFVVPVLNDLAQQDHAAVHVVTHSMGGILLRSAAQQQGLGMIDRVVLLGPPNAGSEVTDRLGSWYLYGLLVGKYAARELRTDGTPSQLPALPDRIETGVIAGNRPRQFPVAWLMPGPLSSHDSKVSIASTHLPHERDHRVLPVDHDAMLRDARVHRHIASFLATGSFADGADGPA